MIDGTCTVLRGIHREIGPEGSDLPGGTTTDEKSLITADKKDNLWPNQKQTLEKSVVIECFARDVLGYTRISRELPQCLAAVLREFERSNRSLAAFQMNQEDQRLGRPNVIRGLQERLYAAGYLHKVIKKRGDISNVVYLYSPHRFVPDCGHYGTNSPSPEEKLQCMDRLLDGEREMLTTPLTEDDLDWLADIP